MFASINAWLVALLAPCAIAKLIVYKQSDTIVLANDRLRTAINTTTGEMNQVLLDDQDLLSTPDESPGRGPYLDCNCVPAGFWSPGRNSPVFEVYEGEDSNGITYGGVSMEDRYPLTNQTLTQYWFLRDGETGLHTFSRVTYFNETHHYGRNLAELRTLFRPNTNLWTDMITNEHLHAPKPSRNATGKTVQDATWYYGNLTGEAYVQQHSDYFTKYAFADLWRKDLVYGFFADGSQSDDGSTFGVWGVMNNKETYYGGPTHGDLVIDGIVYNYMVSNHWGAPTPNLTHGFDRTFGPFYLHFNKGRSEATWADLRDDALQYADPAWNADFYDSIANVIPNYITSAQRGSFKASIWLPEGAGRPIGILSVNGSDYQDNANDTAGHQYWAEIDPETGDLSIDRVIAGSYRLTVYADGIFGDYIQDDITIEASVLNDAGPLTWTPESSGTEIWRIGTPDKSAGEYKHGYEPDLVKPDHPAQYRQYWGVYDFPTEFPDGVAFKIGESKEAKDLNYIHWAAYGGNGSLRDDVYLGDGNVNNWTITFPLLAPQLADSLTATFTIQLAGVKTAAGNIDSKPNEKFEFLPYTVSVNGEDLPPWVIPPWESSSCGVRSSVVCHQTRHRFVFSSDLLVEGTNELVLSLPWNGTNVETAVLPGVVYVQYDALRFELA